MSIEISKVTTRGGDQGQTSLSCGTRVSKSHVRVKLMAQIDTLNCLVGQLRTEFEIHNSSLSEEFHLSKIQNDLFDMGAYLSFEKPSEYQTQFDDSRSELLEDWMKPWLETLDPLKSFVLPGGNSLNSWAHQCRAKSREVESFTIESQSQISIPSGILKYLNRLSDFFFVLARYASKILETPEYLWQAGLKS